MCYLLKMVIGSGLLVVLSTEDSSKQGVVCVLSTKDNNKQEWHVCLHQLHYNNKNVQ